MKTPTALICPACGSRDTGGHGHYGTVHNGTRSLRACAACGEVFSETAGTPMQGIKDTHQQGSGRAAVARRRDGAAGDGPDSGTHKKTIAEWERRFGGMKPTLMLYGLCQTFI